MDRGVRRPRREVERLGLWQEGGWYLASLRAEPLAVCGDRAGLPARQVAWELGVAMESLERWLAEASAERAGHGPALLRVEVEDREAQDARWVVVTPGGYCVKGRGAATLSWQLSELS